MKKKLCVTAVLTAIVALPTHAAWIGTDAGSDHGAYRHDDAYDYLNLDNWDGGVIDGSFAGTDFVVDGSGTGNNVFLWLDDHLTGYPLDLSHGGAGELWLVGRDVEAGRRCL